MKVSSQEGFAVVVRRVTRAEDSRRDSISSAVSRCFFGAKIPGAARDLSSVDMNFSYTTAFGLESPDASERLIADCMVGDSTVAKICNYP